MRFIFMMIIINIIFIINIILLLSLVLLLLLLLLLHNTVVNVDRIEPGSLVFFRIDMSWNLNDVRLLSMLLTCKYAMANISNPTWKD